MPISLWSGTWRGRTAVGDTHSRSREVISPSGGIMRAKFPSQKNGRLVHCEGLLELDAAYLLEVNQEVTRYSEQPEPFHYPDGGRTRRYTPDFEVTLKSGEVVWVEVKPLRSLAKPEVRRTLDCVSSHLLRTGKAFAILTDETLRQEPLRSNARQICHQVERNSASLTKLHSALSRGVISLPTPLGDVTAALRPLGLNPYSLMIAGALRLDLTKPLNPSIEIELVTENAHAWFHLAEEHGF